MNKRAKRVVFALIAAALVCVAGGALYAAYAQEGTVMHVDRVDISVKDMLGRGPRPIVVAHVHIKDQSGNSVSDAEVTGDFSGCFTLTGASATTDSGGPATVQGRHVNCQRTGPCVVAFTVTNLAKTGATYDSSANVETSDSATFCSH